MAADLSKIRNFCIIAHIDHGKSTLADRIIEKTGLLTAREMQSQVLDNMDLERERGITIKAQAVRTIYKAKDGNEYIFNLIDTPGHVDFNYEVSRSLAACDGAILVVDAAQGIEAQTLANVYLALDHDLEVFPVINKIDLPSADPEGCAKEIEDVIGIEAMDAPRISAKTGENVEDVLEAIVQNIPAPTGDSEAPLQALLFDSLYDSYKGVIVFVRIKEGTVKPGDRIRMMATGAEADVVETGVFGAGQFIPYQEGLSAGMVGYITASIKNVQDTRVGDTVTLAKRPASEPLPGYKRVQPMVYCGMYPAAEIDYMEEPFVAAEIIVTSEYIGSIMELCNERRGVYKSIEYIETKRAVLKYDLPLNEIIYDFYDALKSRSRGYASFDYELKEYVRSELVKLDILVNHEEIDALSFIVYAGSAYERGRRMCEKLKEEIPRHLFEIPIQAAIGSKIIARETVKAVRKDVLAKCYGGDITRKKKLLEKQKEGKKRMRTFGNVEIPQSAFMSVLKLDDN